MEFVDMCYETGIVKGYVLLHPKKTGTFCENYDFLEGLDSGQNPVHFPNQTYFLLAMTCINYN
jgi:hypothetical protein